MTPQAAYDQGCHHALAVYSKTAAGLDPQRLANAVIQGGSSLALNLALAPKGDRARQGAIGAVADSLGGYLGGFKGMGASMATNLALQGLTAPKPPQPPPPAYMERFASLLLKTSDHADDRLHERIKADLPKETLDRLREQAWKLTVPPGRYYLNVNDKAGNPAAVAAFKTVGKSNKLVLATVLKPKAKPPRGTSLSHLLKQPTAG